MLTIIIDLMIKSFGDKRTQRLFQEGKATGFLKSIKERTERRLYMLHIAEDIKDLMTPPGNRLETLKGARKGQYSIRINDQYRICFRFEGGHAHDVEITDYH